jgi:hypothetical protein
MHQEQLKAKMPQGWKAIKGIKGMGQSSPTFETDSNPQFISQVTMPNWNQEINQQIGINININNSDIKSIYDTSIRQTEESPDRSKERKMKSIENFEMSGGRKLKDRKYSSPGISKTEPLSPGKLEVPNFNFGDVLGKARNSKLVVSNEKSIELSRQSSAFTETSRKDLLADAIKCSLKKSRSGQNDREKKGAKDKRVINHPQSQPQRRGSKME